MELTINIPIWAMPLAIFYSLYSLWVLFLAVMNLDSAYRNKTIGTTALVIALPVLVVAYTWDILVNIVIGTVLFLQLPHYKRLTLSARLDDHIQLGKGWRRSLAYWMMGHLLEPFDGSGGHTTKIKAI